MKVGGQDSMECYTYLRNVTDLFNWWEDALWKTFWATIKRTDLFHLGWLVGYHPITAKDQSIIHQFGKKVLPGLFLGYALTRVIWKGDVLVADLEELETMDASEIYSKRLNAKELIFSQRKRRIYFSNRRWTNQTFWRRSGTENTHLDTGSSNSRRKSQRFSWRIRRVSSTTSRLISGCRWSDKWLLVHVKKLHIPPSRWTQSQALLAERSIIPYSTEIHRRFQNYTYEFGCQARKTHRWLLEFWCVKRFVWFLDRFHSVCSIGKRNLQKDICGPEGRFTRKQLTSRPDHLWPELWIKLGRNAKLKEPWGQGVQRDHKEFRKKLEIPMAAGYALQDKQEEQAWGDPW